MLGAALALGCLLVFPSAEIWRSDTAEPDVVNGVGNVLISAVVGAFGLITLFLTYESARASRISAEVASHSEPRPGHPPGATQWPAGVAHP